LSRLTVQAFIALILVGTVNSSLLGSSAIIGVVSAEGTFRLNNSAANGHATLFDGNLIQTDETAPRVDLKDGAWMRFGANSRAMFSGHDIHLEGGIGEIGSAKDYKVLAKTLRITPVGSDSVVRVQVAGDHQVLVAAFTAPAQVYNRTGFLVATLKPGETLSFDPQPVAVTANGCLLTKNGRFIVVDTKDTTKVVELRGAELGKELGNQVTINGNAVPGATPMAGASQVVGVTSAVSHIATGGCDEVAAKIGADPPPDSKPPVSIQQTKEGGPKPPGGGHSSTPYIIGGVVVAGGVIGVIVATHKSTSNH